MRVSWVILDEKTCQEKVCHFIMPSLISSFQRNSRLTPPKITCYQFLHRGGDKVDVWQSASGTTMDVVGGREDKMLPIYSPNLHSRCFFFFSLYSTAVERDPGLGFERELSALLRSIHDTLCNATLVAKVWCLAEVWKCSVCSMCSMCSMRAHKQALNHKMFICKGVLRTLHMYNAGFIGLYGVDAGQ